MFLDWREWVREIQRLPITTTVGAIALWLAGMIFGAIQTLIVWIFGLPGPLTALGWLLVFLGLSTLSFLMLGAARFALRGTRWAIWESWSGHSLAEQSVRDVGVGEAIAYIAYGTWGHSFLEAASTSDIDAVWALRQFHQAAADRQIIVWGKKGPGRIYEQIGEEGYWSKNEIEWFELLHGTPRTEAILANDYSQQRFIHLETSRTDVERFVRNQPERVLKAKASARRLSDLHEEGVGERNKLFPIIQNFDGEGSEAVLVSWNDRVLAALDNADVRERDCSRFRTLDTFHPELFGEGGRGDAQERLEMIWNKKLQILRTIIDGVKGLN